MKSKLFELKKTVKEQEKEIRRLRKIVDYDFLTKVYNRHGFLKEAGKFLQDFKKWRGQRKKSAVKNFALIFIDLDGLKKINDSYGHKIGDRYIKKCAEFLKSNLRDIDIVGRWGGDEFVVGLINANKKDAQQISKKLKNKLEAYSFSVEEDELCLRASFGVYSLDKQSSVSLNKIIQKADKEMYKMKKKNR